MYTVVLSFNNPEHERLAAAIGTATVAALFKVVQIRSNATETPIFTDSDHKYTGDDALRHAWAALHAWNTLAAEGHAPKTVLTPLTPTLKSKSEGAVPRRLGRPLASSCANATT